MLAAAVVIAALMAVTRRDVAYLAVLVWAVIGIALKHAATPAVSLAAWAAAAIGSRSSSIWSAVRPLRLPAGRRPNVGVKFQHRFSARAPLARERSSTPGRPAWPLRTKKSLR